MRTALTARTGIEIRRTHEGRWRNAEARDGRWAHFGPDYHTAREAVADQERFLRTHGWLKDQPPVRESPTPLSGIF